MTRLTMGLSLGMRIRPMISAMEMARFTTNMVLFSLLLSSL